GIDPGELRPVLAGQFVTMGEHAGPGAVPGHVAGDGRKHDRLARARGRYAQRVVAGRERSEAALHEEFLAGTEEHRALTAPRRDDRGPAMPQAAGPVPAGVPSARAAGSRGVPPTP